MSIYVVSGKGEKTHAAYLDWDNCLVKLCFPGMPLIACNCGLCSEKGHDDDCGYTAGRREGEEWTQYHNEVTCPTCLRRLEKGLPRIIPEVRYEA